MNNEEVIDQLPGSLKRLITWERFHLHKLETFQNVSCDPAFDTRFFPQNCGPFKLPYFWISRHELKLYGGKTEGSDEFDLLDGIGSNQEILFPFHPLSVHLYKNLMSQPKLGNRKRCTPRLWALPTSSIRTLLVWPDQQGERALFIKTSILPSPMFGDRRIRFNHIGRAVGLTMILKECTAQLPKSFSYLPESCGFVPRSVPDGGVVIRTIPAEIKSGAIEVAPLFSMLGGIKGRQPLFLRLLDHHSTEPIQLIQDLFCTSFSRLWLTMALNFGLILEAHGQDLLLVLSKDFVPLNRFYYRDFEGLQVDWEMRRAFCLNSPLNMPASFAWYDTYAHWGYRYTSLVSYKLKHSLYLYMHLILNELEILIMRWQKEGIIGGRVINKSDVTMMFSNTMMDLIEEMFDTRESGRYNIYHHLNRFILFLLKVRKQVLHRGANVPLTSFSQETK